MTMHGRLQAERGGSTLCVKFTLYAQQALFLTSFKEP
jgi:hypothetical protein